MRRLLPLVLLAAPLAALAAPAPAAARARHEAPPPEPEHHVNRVFT